MTKLVDKGKGNKVGEVLYFLGLFRKVMGEETYLAEQNRWRKLPFHQKTNVQVSTRGTPVFEDFENIKKAGV